ncbi:MAG: hypothetical protein JXR96_23920 [Deltaproteobacteria bacterium]|nr:hypothetical protein [Deltaproteobacteria bacterium]
MRWNAYMLAGSLALACSPAALAVEKAADYLSAKGELRERLELSETRSGFAGINGSLYEIDPDGSWTLSHVAGPGSKGWKEDRVASGKLARKQLAHLAAELARIELRKLPSHGVARVNPYVIAIRFGKRESVLESGRGKASEEEDRAIRERYHGLLEVVRSLCKKPGEKRVPR